MGGAPAKAQVQRRNANEGQPGGGDKAAQHDDRCRMHDLQARHIAQHDKRQHQHRDAQGAGNNGREALVHTALHQRVTESVTVQFQRLEMPHQRDAVAHLEREHRDEAQQRAESEIAPAQEDGDEAAEQRHRHAGDCQQRKPPTAQRDLQNQKPDQRCCCHVAVQRAQRGTLREVLAPHLRVVLERKNHIFDSTRHLTRHVADVFALDFGVDVDAPRHALAADHARGRHRVHTGHIGESHLLALGRVEHQVAYVAEVGSNVRAAEHDHIEHLLLLEQRTDGDARHQRRGGAAHIAWLQSISTGLGKIDLDLNGRFFGLNLDLRIFDAFDLRHQFTNFLSLAADDFLVVAVHPHADGFVVAGEGFAHPLREESIDLGLDAGVGVDRPLQRLQRVFVVCLRINADPDFGRIDVRHFVRKDGSPDMGRGIAYAFDGAQIFHHRCCHPAHRRKR